MRVTIRKRTGSKEVNRTKRRVRIRKRVSGSVERPRLCVFKSSKHIYAQVIDDTTGKTLAAASSLKLEGVNGIDQAKVVGQKIAEMAKGKNISSVVFDRSGYIYHGRVKVLADTAREAGLVF